MAGQFKPIFLLKICLGILCTTTSFAQDGPSKAPESNVFTLSPDDIGKASNTVNLFTGEATLPVNLASIPGSNGLSASVNAAYNSAGTEKIAGIWNREAPTGIMGLGWSIDKPRIIVDNKSTGTKEDDEYYLSQGGASSKLIRIGGSFIKEYALDKYQFWKIIYEINFERWTITTEDGTQYIYGDKNSTRNTLEWIVAWDNWIGNSSRTSNQSQQPVTYLLSEIRNRLGDNITYTYQLVNQKVGSSLGLHQTEASYLTSISSSTGEKIVLNYLSKASNEYYEPHTEKIEPDAFQERYEKLYLKSIDTYSATGIKLNSKNLIYNTIGTGDLTKRLLSAINNVDVNGHNSQGLSFQYHNTLKGKLSTVTTASGGTISYSYASTPVYPANSKRDLTITAPLGYAEPEVHIGNDYVLVTWRQLSNGSHSNSNRAVTAELYTWAGYWKKELTQSLGQVQLENGFRKAYSTALGRDFVAVSVWQTASVVDYKVFIFYKDQTTGTWKTETKFETAGTSGHPNLLAGDNFVALHTFRDGDIFTWVKKNNSWTRNLINQSGNEWHSTATNNYIFSHQKGGNDFLKFHFLNDLGIWSTRSITPPFMTQSDHNSYWHSSNSFAVAMAEGNSEYIYSWDVNYNTFTPHNVLGTLDDQSQVFIQDNALIGVHYEVLVTGSGILRRKTKGNYTRFDGSIFQTLGNQEGWGIGGIGVGSDIITYQSSTDTPGDIYAYSKIFNANSLSWYSGFTTSYDESNNYFTYDTSYPLEPGASNILSLNNLLERNPNGSYNVVGTLTNGSTEKIYGTSVSNISNAIIYNVTNADYTQIGHKVHFVKNGLMNPASTRSGFVSAFYSDKTVKFSWEHNAKLIGASTYITVPNNFTSFENATSLTLHRVINDQSTGLQGHHPVVGITVNDGIQNYSTTFDYDLSNARFDPSGTTAMYNKVTTIPGSSSTLSKPYGYTETFFYNIPSSTTKGDLLIGTPYETKIYDKDQVLVSSSTTSFNLYAKTINGTAFTYIRPMSITSKVDGLTTTTTNTYDINYGVLKSTSITNFNSKGVAEVLKKEFKYAHESGIYATSLVSQNVLNGIVQVKSLNGTTVTSSTATKWTTQNGILQPHNTYLWKGTGSSEFSAWAATPSADWMLSSEIITRDTENNITEIKDIDGFYTSTIYGHNKRVPLTTIFNARASEVFIEDFNDGSFFDNEPGYWYPNIGWITSDKMLKVDRLSSSSIFRTNFVGLQDNIIIEFRMKMDDDLPPVFGQNSGIGFHFKKTASTHTPASSGVFFNVNPYSGFYRLSSYLSGTVATVPMSDSYKWHSYRIVKSGTSVMVYVDSKRIINTTLSPGTGTFFSFYANQAKGYIDDIRIYPNDASAVSTSYNADYLFSESIIDEDGLISYTLFDDATPVAVINSSGSVASTISGYSPRYDGDTFTPTNTNLVHTSAPQKSDGFVENFSPGDGWSLTDASNGVASSWTTSDGELHLQCSGTSTNVETDMYYYILPEGLTGRIGVEFSLKVDVFPNNHGLGIGLGGDQWQIKNGGTEGAIWAGLNTNDISANTLTGWKAVKLNLSTNRRYRLKILIDLDNQSADYFVDGKLLLVDQPFRNPTNDIKKISFYNYGKGTVNPEYIIDNLVVYSDPVQSSVFTDAGGKERQALQQITDNKVLATETIYDAAGRPTITTKPTEINGELSYIPSLVISSVESEGSITEGDVKDLNSNDAYATSKIAFEPSPLSRPLKSSIPGAAYRIGLNNNPTIEYGVTNSNFSTSVTTGSYPMTTTTFPDGGKSFTVTDKTGKLLMKKSGTVKGNVKTPVISTYNLQQGQSFSFTASSNHAVSYNYKDHGGLQTYFTIGTTLGGTEIAVETDFIAGSFNAQQGVTYYFKIWSGLLPMSMTTENNQTFYPEQDSSAMQGTDSLQMDTQSAQMALMVTNSNAAITYASSSTFTTNTDIYLTTTYEYDIYGNLVKIMPPNYHNPPNATVDPNNFVTTNTYDFSGRLKTTTNTDNGTTRYIYNSKNGQLRFVQDAKAAAEGRIIYTKYDVYGRITESGYHSTTWNEATLQNYADASPSWPSATGTWRKKFFYGVHGAFTSEKDSPVRIEINNDTDATAEVVETFTYNAIGQLSSKKVELSGTAYQHTVSYKYDNAGNVVSEDYGEGPGEIIYGYDNSGRLVTIGTISDADYYASYEYDKNGGLAIQKTNNNSIVKNFTYDITGRLIQLDDNYFNETIAYTSNGYGGDGYHNGAIARTTFDHKNITSFGGYNDSYYYAYRYDNVGQLIVGDNSVNNAWDIGVGIGNEMSYDANGNILKKRKGSTTKTYTYDDGTNKINRTSGSARQYHYDGNGNITQSTPKGLTFVYDPYFNKTTSVTHPTGSTSFLYQGDGERVYKKVASGSNWNETFYIRGMGDYPLIEKFKDNTNNTETKYYIYGASGMVAMIHSFENNLMMSSATLEESTIAEEEQKFQLDDGYGNRINAKLFNHTPGDSSKYSLRLSGRNGEQQGLVFTTKVRKGDTVRMEVFAKYIADENDPDVQALLMAIASMTTGSVNPGNGEGIGNTNGPSSQNNGIGNGVENSANKNPKAFLNYILFDTLFNMVDAGYIPVTEEAAEKGNNSAHEQLYIEKISDHDGYMQAFVSNESQQPTEVYFDDMSMTLSSTDQVYFFSTDHLGSTRIMIRQDGSVMKRIDYDPWGEVTRTSGTEDIAYQYTGQEKDKELGLWNFRARFYDADLGRFYGVDPAGQFASPFTGMGNNPVMMIDPNGEIAFLAVVAIYASVQLSADAIRGDINSFKDAAISFGIGALQGALAAAGPGGLAAYTGTGGGWLALGSAVAGQINVPVYSSENFNLSISPSLSAGSTGVRLGANAMASATIDNVTISGGYSIGKNFSATDLSGTMSEAKWSSILSGSIGLNTSSGTYAYGLTKFGGNYSQTVGNVSYSNGKFSASLENDFLSRSGDKFRTAAFRASYDVSNNVSVTGGFSIWTGAPGDQSEYKFKGKTRPLYNSGSESPSAIRNGNLFFGTNFRGNSYVAGINSESIRAGIQNNWHNAMGWPILRTLLGGASPHFKQMNYDSKIYTNFGTFNPFTIYGQ